MRQCEHDTFRITLCAWPRIDCSHSALARQAGSLSHRYKTSGAKQSGAGRGSALPPREVPRQKCNRNATICELAKRRKGEPAKVALARRLRAETTMTLKWNAGELQMGSWTYVSNLLAQPA